jgi:hypothetical protein
MYAAGVPEHDIADILGDTMETTRLHYKGMAKLEAQRAAYARRALMVSERRRGLAAPARAIETTARPIGGVAAVAEPLAIEDTSDDEDGVACV